MISVRNTCFFHFQSRNGRWRSGSAACQIPGMDRGGFMAAMRSWCIIETARGDWGGLAPVRVHDAAAAVSVHRGAVCVLKGNMIRAACGISVRYTGPSSAARSDLNKVYVIPRLFGGKTRHVGRPISKFVSNFAKVVCHVALKFRKFTSEFGQISRSVVGFTQLVNLEQFFVRMDNWRDFTVILWRF